MAYTHTFEIKVKDVPLISGELDFDNPGNGIKWDSPAAPVELSQVYSQKILRFLRFILDIVESPGGADLESVEINIKP